MSSGRSARLPPTPTAAANKPRHSAQHHAANEPNSNNVLQYNNTNSAMTGNAMSGRTHGHSGIGGAGMTGMGLVNMGGNVGNGGGGIGVGVGIGIGSGVVTTADAATEGIPGETIEALGPELAVATSQVLENLSETERKMIIEVLNRDENVRQRDATRIM